MNMIKSIEEENMDESTEDSDVQEDRILIPVH